MENYGGFPGFLDIYMDLWGFYGDFFFSWEVSFFGFMGISCLEQWGTIGEHIFYSEMSTGLPHPIYQGRLKKSSLCVPPLCSLPNKMMWTA